MKFYIIFIVVVTLLRRVDALQFGSVRAVETKTRYKVHKRPHRQMGVESREKLGLDKKKTIELRLNFNLR